MMTLFWREKVFFPVRNRWVAVPAASCRRQTNPSAPHFQDSAIHPSGIFGPVTGAGGGELMSRSPNHDAGLSDLDDQGLKHALFKNGRIFAGTDLCFGIKRFE